MVGLLIWCVENIKTNLSKQKIGDEKFGIPKLEPFTIKKIDSETIGGIPNFHLKSSLKNAEIHGLTSGKILRTATKFNKSYAIKLESEIDKIDIIGNYTMTGKILVLPINGEGKCKITLKNTLIRAESYGNYITKDGETYIDIKDFKMKITPKKVIFNFENLFKNDKKLSDTINTVMNEQWKLVTENLLPGYEANFGSYFIEVANKIFHNVPFNKIYRD